MGYLREMRMVKEETSVALACPALASIPCARCQEAIAGVYRLTRAAVARYPLPWTETLISHPMKE